MKKGKYPQVRMRRTRQTAWSRRMVAETELTTADLIQTFFVHEKKDASDIKSMPGIKRYSIAQIVLMATRCRDLGIPAIALFPVVPKDKKNETGSEALDANNLVCRTIKAIKKTLGDTIGVIADVALDPYTSHGHDGLVENCNVVNDKTVEVLCKQAITLAKAGADVIAPSDMMDGRVGEIRKALDKAGFENVMILSYAAKYASSFYGPFRDAIGAADLKGDKQSYQMDPRNSDEALLEVALDIEEGADMVMVKPALAYLDIIRRVHQEFKTHVFAYQVSGEYAMIRAGADAGYLNYHAAMMESLIAIKRAGAVGIFTYAAIEVAEWLRNQRVKECSYSG
jgi:porphobilinogen synthase